MLEKLKRIADYARCAVDLGPTASDKWDLFLRLTKNVRAQFKLASYHPHTIYSTHTRYGTFHFRDNFGDITNLFKLIYQNEYRFRNLSGEGAIVDVGANIGLTAGWFAFHNPGRKIYCFEPLADNVRLIRLNCPSANVRHAAVGSAPGQLTLRVDPDNIMASSIPNPWVTKEVTFEVTTLDRFAEEETVESIALLKIDAEVMEDEILRGASDVLKRTRNIVLETHGRLKHDSVREFLRRSGFGIDSEVFDGGTGLLFASRAVSPA